MYMYRHLTVQTQLFQFILKDSEKVNPKVAVFAPMAWFVQMWQTGLYLCHYEDNGDTDDYYVLLGSIKDV